MNQDSLLHKARQLIQLGVIVAAPMPALADDIELTPPPPVSSAALRVDHSAVGTYSNSGFFTGELDEARAGGSALGMGFKLSGQTEFHDSQLYDRLYGSCWDGVCDASTLYYDRGDTTGVAFVWGGKVTGQLVNGDQLKAAYEFMLDWTHTVPADLGYDYASVNWALSMGFANASGVEGQVGIREILGNRRGYNSTSGSLYDTGATTLTGELSAQHHAYEWEENPDWYWFVVLEAHLNEAGPRWTYYGDPAPGSINGDVLRVTVPQNSIDIGVNAVPVPEPESWAMGVAGVAVAGLLAQRRRRARG